METGLYKKKTNRYIINIKTNGTNGILNIKKLYKKRRLMEN